MNRHRPNMAEILGGLTLVLFYHIFGKYMITSARVIWKSPESENHGFDLCEDYE